MKTISDCNYVVQWYLAPRLLQIELSDKFVLWTWTRMLFKTERYEQ